MRSKLFNTIARVTGARKAKKLIQGLVFTDLALADFDQNEKCLYLAFDWDYEQKGWYFWFNIYDKGRSKTGAPDNICLDCKCPPGTCFCIPF